MSICNVFTSSGWLPLQFFPCDLSGAQPALISTMSDEEKGSQQVDDNSTNGAKKTVDDVDHGDIDIDLEAWGEEHGYPLDVEILKEITPKWRNYQLASDGRTVLIPQPSSDPDDVLNWAWKKKHIILFVVAATSFLPDYGSATGAVTLIPQSM